MEKSVKACVCVFLLLAPAAAIAQTPAKPALNHAPVVQGVVRVGLTVSDLERSVRFFENVLTFAKTSEAPAPGNKARVARLKLGDEQIELTQHAGHRGRLFPPDSRSNDLWFQHIAIIVSDMDKAVEILRAHKVRGASVAPQRLPDWNKNASGIRAYYFRDPDGHFLEILQFPPDKGLPKWHRHSGRLFLGIDHTAIVVSDTRASLRFYRDALGMVVAGGSENYGPEQAALNNVPGAHLRITTLRGASGPGIELLEYLMPRDGRPYPSDAEPQDLLHWQTSVAVKNIESAITAARAAGGGPLDLDDAPPANPAQTVIRDPDGHAIQFVNN